MSIEDLSTKEDQSGLQLRSLAPEYDASRHSNYVSALTRAIDDQPKIRNIALTGAYGTGKSSILAEIARKYPDRVLELSLSTVSASSDPRIVSDGAKGADASDTNRIQKEIVKQILYKDRPSKTPGSRFRRIEKFRLGLQVGLAASASLVLIVLFSLLGVVNALLAPVGSGAVVQVLARVALWIILGFAILGLRWLTRDRFFLQSLTAGPATISLAENSTSYFDQYLDEIVYYFEVSGRDIVIFEDIDRFDNVSIFETLRALNTLLNGAEQVRNRRRKTRDRVRKKKSDITVPDVRFIYALRDSIFEKIGTTKDASATVDFAVAEVERANRTKFFDLVIPVVPFITYRNARDLMTEVMEGTGVSSQIIDLAGKHLADMRLIHNLRNEYDIFAAEILNIENPMPGLDEDRLFAMVLYKNVHMKDFEAIRVGESRLDLLHKAWRELVDQNLATESKIEAEATDELDEIDSLAKRSGELGQRLEALASVLARGAGRAVAPQIVVNSRVVTPADLQEPDLWRQLIEQKQTVVVNVPPYGTASTIVFEDLKTFFPNLLDVEFWTKRDRSARATKRQNARSNLKFLRHHTWEQVYGRNDLLLRPVDGDLKPVASVSEANGAVGESFRVITGRLLDSRLACDLVSQGFINDYFALYISAYYGRHLRLDALNYVVRSLDPGEPDALYPLEPEDVRVILADKGDSVLFDPGIYNVFIADYLLTNDRAKATVLVNQLSAWGKAEEQFVRSYLQYGARRRMFVELLSSRARLILNAVEEVEIDEATRVDLLDAALSHLSKGIDYPPNSDVEQLVRDNYSDFASLTSKKLSLHKPTTMSAISNMGIRLPLIAPLNGPARAEALRLRAFEINSSNLVELSGQTSLTLDALKNSNGALYELVLDELPSYLAVLRGAKSASIGPVDAAEFAQILNDVRGAEKGPECMGDVVELADARCRVDRLAQSPVEAWQPILAGLRTKSSDTNVATYVTEFKEIDESLGEFLKAQHSILHDDLPEAERRTTGLLVLGSSRELPDAELRVRLLGDLETKDAYPAGTITPESGKLVGLLIMKGLIADDQQAFSDRLMVDWPTREFAMSRSKNLPSFMAPEFLPGKDIGRFFASKILTPPLKQLVLGDLDKYATDVPAGALRAAADFALTSRANLEAPTIELLREHGATDSQLVELITKSDRIPIEDLRILLREIGSDYATIADPGSRRPAFPNDEPHRALLGRLREAQIVRDFKVEKGRLRVYLRSPTP